MQETTFLKLNTYEGSDIFDPLMVENVNSNKIDEFASSISQSVSQQGAHQQEQDATANQIETRVGQAETNIDTMQNSIGTIEANINLHTTQINSLNESIMSVNEAVQDAQTAANGAQTAAETADGKATTAGETANAAMETATEAKAAAESAQTKINKINIAWVTMPSNSYVAGNSGNFDNKLIAAYDLNIPNGFPTSGMVALIPMHAKVNVQIGTDDKVACSIVSSDVLFSNGKMTLRSYIQSVSQLSYSATNTISIGTINYMLIGYEI